MLPLSLALIELERKVHQAELCTGQLEKHKHGLRLQNLFLGQRNLDTRDFGRTCQLEAFDYGILAMVPLLHIQASRTWRDAVVRLQS